MVSASEQGDTIRSGNVFDLKIVRRLLTYVRPYKRVFYGLIGLTLLLSILGPMRPFLVQVTIDEHIATGDELSLWRMSLLLLGLLMLQGVVQYYNLYFSGVLGQRIVCDIRTQLYAHVQRLSLRFFDKTPIGRLVTRCVSDIETLASVFSQGLAVIIGDLLQLIAILTLMLLVDWRLALVSLSTLPILLLSTYIFKEKIKVAFNKVRIAVARLNVFVQEHITGMNIVQIFNSEQQTHKKFQQINQEHRRAHMRSVMYFSIYFPIAEIIHATGLGLLVWYGARETIQDRLTLGVLVSFIMYIQMFFRPIRMIADRFNTLQLGLVSAHRIFQLLDDKAHMVNAGTQKAEGVRGHMVFEHVWFAYEESAYVLRDLSFEVKPGEVVALVGATGAGKTSIIHLLNRFYDIQKGSIRIDGVDIRDYELSSLRAQIGLVLQDVFLFSDTLAANLAMHNGQLSRAEIMDMVDMVGGRAFIEELPEGLDHAVFERGATLSVGQRQLISFIRAMLYAPRIVVLDEATSSIDSDTEALVQQAMQRLMRGRSALIIAHRLSTIQHADQILVLDQGEIKERGTHEALLRKKDGYYTRLHRMQYKDEQSAQTG